MQSRESNMSYTENEAAEKLGVSVDQLRTLVRSHISRGEESGAISNFRPSDLVVLRILAATGQSASSATA
jgi:hypothetical protein